MRVSCKLSKSSEMMRADIYKAHENRHRAGMEPDYMHPEYSPDADPQNMAGEPAARAGVYINV